MRSQAHKGHTTLRNAGIAVLGFLFLGTQPSARADAVAYAVTASGQFGTIDLSTGVFTEIGNMGPVLTGLGAAGGNLYGGANLGSTLYEINPSTGTLTAVGMGSITYADFGSTTSGLYAVNCLASCGVSGIRSLYSINPATGAATLIGSTGVGQDTVGIGMSSGSGTLYFTSDSNLYSLNTTTGAATLIGNTGVSAIGALVFENGVLYGGSYPSKQLYTLNTSTGAATLVTSTSGISEGFEGLAPFPQTSSPTPQILSQLAFGGGWYTALYFTNISSSPASFTVNFIGDDGNPLIVPALGGSSATVNLAARGTAVIQAPNVGSLVQGYVSVALPSGVTAYGVFRQSVPGQQDQEAVVPLSGTTATTSTLLFDDTNYTTGVAVVNLASVSTTISVTAYGNQGNVVGTSSIPLAANAKTAVVLRDLPGLAGIAGTPGSVDFTAPIGNLAVLGLRFNGLAFTSIPTFNP